MAGTQRHRAHSRWDDESPKALEDSAPKRQKVNDAQRSATIPRQLTCTAANGLLMFIEVHKVNDRMTIGSFFYAFEEARPQLSILRLHEGVTVGTLKVLMRILIHGLQTTTPEDVSRKDTPAMQDPLSVSPQQAAKLQSSESGEDQSSRKRKRDDSSREKEAASLAGEDALKKNGNVPNNPDSAPQKRKRKETEPDECADPDIRQDDIAHVPSQIRKKAKLGHPYEVTVPKPTRESPPVADKSKKPRAKEPLNRFQLTPSLKPGLSREAGLSGSVRKDPRTANECEKSKAEKAKNPDKRKPKPKAEATASVKPDVNHAPSRHNPRISDEHDKSGEMEVANAEKSKSKRRPGATTSNHLVTGNAPNHITPGFGGVSKKPGPKEAKVSSNLKPKPTPKATTLAKPIANGVAPRVNQKTTDDFKKPRRKEPQNRFQLTDVYKPKTTTVSSARSASHKSQPRPPLRENKRTAFDFENSENEMPEDARKRRKMNSSTKTGESVLSDKKARPSSQVQKSSTFNMMDFMKSNGVLRQYQVERPSLAEELAEQDRLTAERRKRERRDRMKK